MFTILGILSNQRGVMKNVLRVLLGILLFSQSLYGALSWTSPVSISTNGVDASSQQVAMDGSGNAVAIWVENGNILTKSLPLNGSWSSATTLSSSGLASNPQIVSDPSGNVTAIWLDNGVVNWASATTTGSWTTHGALSGSGASTPEIAVDSAGDVVVVWALGGFIQSKTKLFGGSFPVTADVISLSGSDSPQVAIGANGTVVAVWHAILNSLDTIYAATKTINGSWNTSQDISFDFVNSVNAQVAVDANGNASVIWYAFSISEGVISNVVVQNTTLPFGGSWDVPVDITTASTTGIYNPLDFPLKLAFDTSGNAVAVWITSTDGYTFDVLASVKPGSNNGIVGIDQNTDLQVSNTWISPVSINVFNLYGFACDLAVNSNGDSFIVFMSFNPGDSVISNSSSEMQAASYTIGFADGVFQVSTGTTDGLPKIVGTLISNTHNLVSVWVDFDGTNNIIQASYGTTDAIQPPTDLAVNQSQPSFGFFTDNMNTVTWSASPSPNISAYLVFRNGTFLQEVFASGTLQFIDHNRLAGEIDTYGIAAIDNTGLQSPVAFITPPAF